MQINMGIGYLVNIDSFVVSSQDCVVDSAVFPANVLLLMVLLLRAEFLMQWAL